MRTLSVLICLGLAACDSTDSKETDTAAEADTDTDTDADTDTDTDADADTDTDTDTTPTSETDCYDGVDEDKDGATDCEDSDCASVCVEDCSDKIDNDQDGLTDCDDVDDCTCTETDCYDGIDEDDDGLQDCEDDDCFDTCVEDCRDGADNDQDGATDCDDDECYGVGSCTGPYNFTAEVSYNTFAWGWGPDWASYVGTTYNLSLFSYGSVYVLGTPDGWSGSDIRCNGQVYTGLNVPYFSGVAYIGPYSGVDYAAAFEATVANGALQWSGGCPVSGLPYTVLGMTADSYVVKRLYGGLWYDQYTAATLGGGVLGKYPPYGYDISVNYLYTLTQRTPLSWDASY